MYVFFSIVIWVCRLVIQDAATVMVHSVISGEGQWPCAGFLHFIHQKVVLYFLVMKETPSDKCLWHHVASLYPEKLQHYEFDPVAIFLGQYRGDLPGDYVVFKACQLTASWLRRPNTCNRFQMKVSLCDIFEKSSSSSTENRVISSPHMSESHPWSERASSGRNKMKQNKQDSKIHLWLWLRRVNERFARLHRVQVSWQSSGFSSPGSEPLGQMWQFIWCFMGNWMIFHQF